MGKQVEGSFLVSILSADNIQNTCLVFWNPYVLKKVKLERKKERERNKERKPFQQQYGSERRVCFSVSLIQIRRLQYF